jgi:4-hydroxybenzoate polyprenyltransferase
MKDLITALRPRHWVKNLLVIAPVLFSRHLFSPDGLIKGLSAFGLFCAVSSSCYLINDVRDIVRDRVHPVKRYRPIAAGKLSTSTAWAAALVLLILGMAGAALLNKNFALVLGLYWLITLAYTFVLKQQVILDVFSVALGFVLRAVAGAVVIGVEISGWLLICTTLLALFLGFSKRRYELLLLREAAGDHRQVLEEYNPHFLDMMIAIVTASTVTSYALYTASEETVQRFHTRKLLLTLPFVLYGIFRYLYLIYHKERGGDPIETALTDPPTIINLVLWAVTVAVILYWP